MSDSKLEFENCSLCCEYNLLVKVKCCKQILCEDCLETWVKSHSDCPFCRSNVVEIGWTRTKINAGYKLSVICNTLESYNVKTVIVSLEEFDTLSPYFEDYVRIDKSTEIGNECICSKRCSTVYYGTQKCIIVHLNSQEYFEYYVCSQCFDYSPRKVWKKMLSGKKDSFLTPDLGRMRDELVSKISKAKMSKRTFANEYVDEYARKPDFPDKWKAVEKTLYTYYLKDKGYLSVTEFKFIVSLVKICSGNIDLSDQSILHFMLKYLAEPHSPDIHPNFFVKHFVRNAWERSANCPGFMGLYPTISLWKIIRDPDEKFVEETDTYYETVEYTKRWLNDVGLS